MASKELQELQVQIALGLITDRDLRWALIYPNRHAPGEGICWGRTYHNTTIFTHLANRKYIIDSKGPNDVLRFIAKRVNGPKRT